MKRYIKSLQILRALALVMVYIFHQDLADESFSRFGVCLFFILSGFLSIYHGYDRETECSILSCIRTAIHRIRRIFPLHVLMLILAFGIYCAGNWTDYVSGRPASIVYSGIRFLTNLFLVSGWFPHLPDLDCVLAEYNIATWFLSDCLLFYIFTPFIIKFMHRIYDAKETMIRPVAVMICIFAYTIILNMVFILNMGYTASFWYIYSSPVSRIGDYLIGAQLAVIYMLHDKREDHIAKPLSRTVPTIMMILSFVLTVILLYIGIVKLDSPEKYIVSTGFYFTVPVCGLVIATSLMSRELDENVEKSVIGRILIWLGGISPYAYLIQVPVINAVHGIYKRLTDVRISIWCIISVCITLIGSVLYKRWLDLKTTVDS